MKNTAHYLRSHVSAIVKFTSFPKKIGKTVKGKVKFSFGNRKAFV